jgi:hypothetical protein
MAEGAARVDSQQGAPDARGLRAPGENMPLQDATPNLPGTLADLHLPPTFVGDHCIRTLASQGAMTLVELAKHWRVPGEVAAQAIEPPKAAGLIETETNRSNLETLQKWRLSAAGQARVETARARTWYAGPLPVSLADYERRPGPAIAAASMRVPLRQALAPFFLAEPDADEIAQAVASGASVAVGGIAPDEQYTLAAALHGALPGQVTVPQAIFAAGTVMRVFDPRVHRASSPRQAADNEDSDLLRSRESVTQWTTVPRPLVAISGGVALTDVVPAFDEDARFYLAPAPLVAAGGLLALCDGASSDAAALDSLARNWIVPARRGGAVLLLRTGERIEIPWQAALLIFADIGDLPARAAAAVQYAIDASAIRSAALRGFLAARLTDGVFGDDAIETIAEVIERTDMATRTAGAAVAQYLRDSLAYRGQEFVLSEQTLSAALQYAATRQHSAPLRRAA